MGYLVASPTQMLDVSPLGHDVLYSNLKTTHSFCTTHSQVCKKDGSRKKPGDDHEITDISLSLAFHDIPENIPTISRLMNVSPLDQVIFDGEKSMSILHRFLVACDLNRHKVMALRCELCIVWEATRMSA